eukprot:UN4620
MALKRVTDTQPLLQIISVCRRAWRFVMQPLVNLGGTAPSADLGGSSNYSNENFED